MIHISPITYMIHICIYNINKLEPCQIIFGPLPPEAGKNLNYFIQRFNGNYVRQDMTF